MQLNGKEDGMVENLKAYLELEGFPITQYSFSFNVRVLDYPIKCLSSKYLRSQVMNSIWKCCRSAQNGSATYSTNPKINR